jgi:hypothetical protein
MREHGTHAKYAVERCRCELCRQAQRAYNRNRVRQLSRPDGVWCPYVDAKPARNHLEWLSTCGVGIKTVAKVGGLSHGTLSKLVYGDPQRGMGPSKRIRPATAEKILAVMPAMAGGGQKVPAGATWRLLDELIARGWSRSEIARRLGAQSPALQLSRVRVRASTARAVELLHADLIQVAVVPKKTRWGVRPTPVPSVPVVARRARHPRTAGEYPLASLAEAAGMSENVLCLHLGLNPTRAREGLDECQADELATSLGFHPMEVWATWLVPA